MKKLFCNIFIILTFFAVLDKPASAYAEPVLELSGDGLSVDIIPYCSYLRDYDNNIPAQDVISGKLDSRFTENHEERLAFKAHYLWLKLRVRNISARSIDYVIEGTQIVLPKEKFYIIDSKNNIVTHTTGALVNDSAREIFYNRSVVPINLEPGEEKLVYLNAASAKTYGAVQYSITAKDRFISTSYKVSATENLLVGAILILAIYNLFLFLSVRDKIYLYYSTYVLCSLFGTVFEENSGTISPFIPRFYHAWHYEIYNVLVPIFIVFLNLFARNFLHFSERSYKASNVIITLTLIDMVFGTAYMPFVDIIKTVVWNYIAAYVLIEASSAVILYNCIVNIRQGYRPALYYLIAFLFFALGVTLYFLYMENILPSNVISSWSGRVGLLFEATLMSFALADRIRQMRLEEEQLIVELTESNTELERFAYICSHDLQEPLRMISNYTQLLMRHLGDSLDEKGQRYAKYVIDGAVNARALITDILAYAKIGTESEKTEPVDCENVLSMVIKHLETPILEAAAHITHDELPSVQAYRTQVTQLFQNLISNAIKFRHHDRPPIIHVGAKREGEFWQFSVSDNGIGIAEAHQERIFQIFQRLNKRKDYPGTGIGLAICNKIIEYYGGKIWVKSEPGVGTTFFFTLPAVM